MLLFAESANWKPANNEGSIIYLYQRLVDSAGVT